MTYFWALLAMTQGEPGSQAEMAQIASWAAREMMTCADREATTSSWEVMGMTRSMGAQGRISAMGEPGLILSQIVRL